MRGFNLIVNISKQSFAWNLLVLVALVGTVSLGWLAGHILRYSIPALWHLPIQETNPQIKNGFEFEFEGEPIILTPQENPWVRVYIGGEPAKPPERCMGYTYYTSLPAKCHTAGGRLVRVGGIEAGVFVIPGDR
jgi:hypothetical protein